MNDMTHETTIGVMLSVDDILRWSLAPCPLTSSTYQEALAQQAGKTLLARHVMQSQQGKRWAHKAHVALQLEEAKEAWLSSQSIEPDALPPRAWPSEEDLVALATTSRRNRVSP